MAEVKKEESKEVTVVEENESPSSIVKKKNLRLLMIGEGAQLISADALVVMTEFLTKLAKEKTKKALTFTTKDKRKTISKDDMTRGLV